MSNRNNSRNDFRYVMSYALKIITIACAAIGVLRSMGAGSKAFMGGNTTLLYFTIPPPKAHFVRGGAGGTFCVALVSLIWYN